jgi:hypothetical protein
MWLRERAADHGSRKETSSGSSRVTEGTGLLIRLAFRMILRCTLHNNGSTCVAVTGHRIMLLLFINRGYHLLFQYNLIAAGNSTEMFCIRHPLSQNMKPVGHI